MDRSHRPPRRSCGCYKESTSTIPREQILQSNRAQRLAAALERDGATCVWCSARFDALTRPTTEHLVPRVKGGPSWAENEVAACRRCNGQRGHRSPADWLAECVGRGWSPDPARVLRALLALDEAVAERGGQRRARPYIAHQVRRLRRADAR